MGLYNCGHRCSARGCIFAVFKGTNRFLDFFLLLQTFRVVGNLVFRIDLSTENLKVI